MCRPFAVNLFYDIFMRHSSAVKYSSVKWDKKVLKCIKEEIGMEKFINSRSRRLWPDGEGNSHDVRL